MATSCSTLVRDALIAIANADTTLRTLTGRTTRIMVPWKTVAAATKPVLAVMIASNVRADGLGDRRRVLALLGAFAEGSGALDKAEALIQRAREVYTPAAFQAQSLDAFVAWGDAAEREVEEEGDGVTLVAHAQLDLPVVLSAPR